MDTTLTRGIGDNRAPETDPLLERLNEDHRAITKRKDDLLFEADMAPETVGNEDTAKQISDLISEINKHVKSTDKVREGEKAPFLTAGRTVDGFFKGVTEPLEKAAKKLNVPLTTYQRKKADDERRAREETERRAKEEAERAAKEAEAKIAALESSDDLAGAIAAEEASNRAAAEAEKAKREAEAKAAELSRTRSAKGSVASLRTFWNFADLDRATVDLEALRSHLPQDALEKAVRSYISAGGRELRGVRIFEDAKTVVR